MAPSDWAHGFVVLMVVLARVSVETVCSSGSKTNGSFSPAPVKLFLCSFLLTSKAYPNAVEDSPLGFSILSSSSSCSLLSVNISLSLP